MSGSALNVAALACRGENEAAIIADYNGLLAREKPGAGAPIPSCRPSSDDAGRAWQTQQDVHMTRVYNFFALPPAQKGFCTTAAAVLARPRWCRRPEFEDFARRAWCGWRHRSPTVYRAYDGYRRDLAAWDARYGVPPGGAAPVALAAASATVPSPARPNVQRVVPVAASVATVPAAPHAVPVATPPLSPPPAAPKTAFAALDMGEDVDLLVGSPVAQPVAQPKSAAVAPSIAVEDVDELVGWKAPAVPKPTVLSAR
jgi:hypothetical protein